jgi:hypothetical protein
MSLRNDGSGGTSRCSLLAVELVDKFAVAGRRRLLQQISIHLMRSNNDPRMGEAIDPRRTGHGPRFRRMDELILALVRALSAPHRRFSNTPDLLPECCSRRTALMQPSSSGTYLFLTYVWLILSRSRARSARQINTRPCAPRSRNTPDPVKVAVGPLASPDTTAKLFAISTTLLNAESQAPSEPTSLCARRPSLRMPLRRRRTRLSFRRNIPERNSGSPEQDTG